MVVFTDSIEYAERVVPPRTGWQPADVSRLMPPLRQLVDGLCSGGPLYRSGSSDEGRWTYAFAVREAPSSNFDILSALSSGSDRLPDRLICLAESGRDFHGQKGRPWVAVPGNIHLSCLFSPRRRVERFHTGFPVVAAVSVVETIDSLDGLRGRAAIKWVNDVLIAGAKVAGFLVRTSTIEETVSSAVLGIGLNVDTTPRVPPDPFVPKVASLADFLPFSSHCNQERVLSRLLDCLDKNYGLLLAGRYPVLLGAYRERSLVIGRKVNVLSDSSAGPPRVIAAGTVCGIGENLELFLENREKPVTKGRLVLVD